MHYKASFDYTITTGDGILLNDLPLRSFSVGGGATRLIRLDSTDDISIASELEQARLYKNIWLYLPPTNDHRDMQAALDAANVVAKRSTLDVFVNILKYSGGKYVEGLWLAEPKASILVPPYITPTQHLLVLILGLPEARLTRGKDVLKAESF